MLNTGFKTSTMEAKTRGKTAGKPYILYTCYKVGVLDAVGDAGERADGGQLHLMLGGILYL